MRGFTLLELVVVVAIIATVSAIVTPRYVDALARFRMQTASERIAADLDQARAWARMTSAPVRVRFDVAADRYELETGDPLSEVDDAVALADEPYQVRLAAVDIEHGTLVYDGYGAPRNGGDIVLANGRYRMTLNVHPVSGAVTRGPLEWR